MRPGERSSRRDGKLGAINAKPHAGKSEDAHWRESTPLKSAYDIGDAQWRALDDRAGAPCTRPSRLALRRRSPLVPLPYATPERPDPRELAPWPSGTAALPRAPALAACGTRYQQAEQLGTLADPRRPVRLQRARRRRVASPPRWERAHPGPRGSRPLTSCGALGPETVDADNDFKAVLPWVLIAPVPEPVSRDLVGVSEKAID